MNDFNQVLSTILSKEIVKTTIVIFIFPIMLKYFENRYLSDVAQRKNVWNSFIRTNGTIKDCLDRYNKIEKESKCSTLFYYFISSISLSLIFLILFLSTIVYFLCFKLAESFQNLTVMINRESITSNDIILLIISFFVLLSSLIPIYFCKRLQNYVFQVKDEEILLKFSKVNKFYSIVIIYSFILFLFSINILFNINKFFNILVLFAMCIFVISFYDSLLSRKQYIQRVKDYVNNGYSRNFPYLEISTLGGKDVFGKLKNVFHSECIILHNGEEYITILWSSISTLKEMRKNDFQGQKTLSDFFPKDD